MSKKNKSSSGKEETKAKAEKDTVAKKIVANLSDGRSVPVDNEMTKELLEKAPFNNWPKEESEMSKLTEEVASLRKVIEDFKVVAEKLIRRGR